MKILVVGLNHRTAPIDIRERLAFDAAQTVRALKHLSSRFDESEFVLLSTCNRVELYSAGKRVGGLVAEDLTKFLSEFHGVRLEDFQNFLYVHSDGDAVRHLLTVASSLDSMVVGEAQIIRQVKESYRLACSAKSTGKILNRLFHCAFRTSKKVHTNTSIANRRVSVAGVAVQFAEQLFPNVSSAEIVVVGAGETGKLLVQHFLHSGCTDVTVVNRSYDRGLEMAERHRITAVHWEQLGWLLLRADIVATAVTTQSFLFNKDSFKKIMDERSGRPLLVIDIAVPRNFAPAINEIENVYLYSIDDLTEVVRKNVKLREEDMERASAIIGKKVNEFMQWFGVRDIGPLVGQMKQHFHEIAQNELQRFFVEQEEIGFLDREDVEVVVERIINRLAHGIIEDVNVVANRHGQEEAIKIVNSILEKAEDLCAVALDEGLTNL
jgi:glutamyl-tRNA reductase